MLVITFEVLSEDNNGNDVCDVDHEIAEDQ
jgi:hypothetical protein